MLKTQLSPADRDGLPADRPCQRDGCAPIVPVDPGNRPCRMPGMTRERDGRDAQGRSSGYTPRFSQWIARSAGLSSAKPQVAGAEGVSLHRAWGPAIEDRFCLETILDRGTPRDHLLCHA